MDKEKIRKRQSYEMFAGMLEFLNTKPSKKTILQRLYRELDKRYSFGSERNSTYADESLRLLIKDKQL